VGIVAAATVAGICICDARKLFYHSQVSLPWWRPLTRIEQFELIIHALGVQRVPVHGCSDMQVKLGSLQAHDDIDDIAIDTVALIDIVDHDVSKGFSICGCRSAPRAVFHPSGRVCVNVCF